MKKSIQTGFFLILFSVFVTLLFVIPVGNVIVSAEDDVDEIEEDIEKLEKKIKEATRKKDALEGSLSQINSSLSSTQQAIQKTLVLLNTTEQTIEQKEQEIGNLELQMRLEREVLKKLIREMYFTADVPFAKVMLTEDENYFQDNDNLFSTQEKMQEVVRSIADMKTRVTDEKVSLEDVKKDHEELLVLKNKQKAVLVSEKVETQSDINEQQADINRLKRELSELEGDLSKLLGKSYNAKDIKEAVEFASKATGVPKGFLFGVLKMETNLGANVGGCTYAEVEAGAEKNYKSGKLSKKSWTTFQWRRDLFKGITKELDIDYKKQKVSCNPRGYTGTGGAMGVAQFMPDTWNGYKSSVASATGHRPPSPWNLTDGVMAMAQKLDRVPGVDDGNRTAWKKAAAAYLGTSYAPYINGILYWADHYKELF